jgi:hypothetical protein
MTVRIPVAPGKSSFNPFDAYDPTFNDPGLRAAREDVTTSSTIAFALASPNKTALKDMKSEELDALLKIEALSKPNPDQWYAAFKAEEAKFITQQETYERVIRNRSDFMNEGARKSAAPPGAEGRESDYATRLGGTFNVDETEFRRRATALLNARGGSMPMGSTDHMNPNQLRTFVRQATGQWMNEVIRPTGAGAVPLTLAPQGRQSDFATRNKPLPPAPQTPGSGALGAFAAAPKPKPAPAPLPGKAADDLVKPKTPAAPKPPPPPMPTPQSNPGYYASEKYYAPPPPKPKQNTGAR